MKIGIEGSLFFKRSSGVGHYAKCLTEAAAKIDSDIDFEIVRHWLPFKKVSLPIKPNKNLHYRLVRWFPPAIYYQVFKRLGRFLPYDFIALRNYDAFLFFNFIAFPLRKKTKSIIVIHDLSFVYHPEFTQAKNLKFTPKLTKRSIKRASHIITVSQNSKSEIVKYYKVSPENITVIPNAVDHAHFYPRTQAEINTARIKYGLPPFYIHFHGTLEPRKNIVGILEAYENLPDDLKHKYALVLTGGKGWNDEPMYKKIDKLRATGHNIILPGYIEANEVDLPALYSGASLFVWPSFYEGFGVPPLEAMACGVPVITSKNSSLPEVVGDAAIMINAKDTLAISTAMTKILSDKRLAHELVKKGFTQAQKFTWEKSARRLVELLKDL